MTPEHAALVRNATTAWGLALDDAVLARIDRFLGVLQVWNRTVRLTADPEVRTILVRHVIDSLAPIPSLPPSARVVDVGSGAGFPGIILGCARPDLDLVLIEARRRRASFLGEAIRMVPLPHARVTCARAEDVAAELHASAAVAITRALRLETFLPVARELLAGDAFALAMQTPGTVATARSTARAAGFDLADVREYALPDGRRRALLRFTRRMRG